MDRFEFNRAFNGNGAARKALTSVKNPDLTYFLWDSWSKDGETFESWFARPDSFPVSITERIENRTYLSILDLAGFFQKSLDKKVFSDLIRRLKK